MSSAILFSLAAGLVAILYGGWLTRKVLVMPAGNDKMQEIAAAIQVGAKAFLNRQYKTIGIIGGVLFLILLIIPGFNYKVALGFLVGAVFSALAG